MLNQNIKKSPGIEFPIFNCTGDMGMDNFGYLNSSISFMNLRKKIIAYVHLQLNLPAPPLESVRFSPFFPFSERSNFMDGP